MIDIPDSIFPTDASGNLLCPKCAQLIKDCDCPSGDPKPSKAKPILPVIRLDKSGRRGKIVTLISNLPRNESYLKELAKTLKIKTGSGGTHYISDECGIVEIQGDHKAAITDHFRKK